MAEHELLTVADIATHLRVSEETVREWLRKNEISGFNLGGRSGWRIPAGEIDRFLATRVGKRVAPVAKDPTAPDGAGE